MRYVWRTTMAVFAALALIGAIAANYSDRLQAESVVPNRASLFPFEAPQANFQAVKGTKASGTDSAVIEDWDYTFTQRFAKGPPFPPPKGKGSPQK